MPCLCHVRSIGKANSDAQRAELQAQAMWKTKSQAQSHLEGKALQKTHLKGKVFDSMLAREVLQLCPLLTVCLCNLSGAIDVLQGRLSQKCGLHDSPQLKMALAMGCVQCFVTNQLGDGVGPFTCGIVATVSFVQLHVSSATVANNACNGYQELQHEVC